MGKRLYVGNLSYAVTDAELTHLFEHYGDVVSAEVVTDRYSGRSRGFGFVEMETEQEAAAAIEGLHGKEESGRALTVNEAKPRVARG